MLMRLENPSRFWLPHLEFDQIHISFHNLGQIFRELYQHTHKKLCVFTNNKSIISQYSCGYCICSEAVTRYSYQMLYVYRWKETNHEGSP